MLAGLGCSWQPACSVYLVKLIIVLELCWVSCSGLGRALQNDDYDDDDADDDAGHGQWG